MSKPIGVLRRLSRFSEILLCPSCLTACIARLDCGRDDMKPMAEFTARERREVSPMAGRVKWITRCTNDHCPTDEVIDPRH